MKSRSEIWFTALEELGDQCSVDTARDATTVERRATQEGDTFFKVTLPQFAKDLERSLAAGYIPTTSFTGWARRNRNVYVVSDSAWIADDGRSGNEPCLHQGKLGGGVPRFLGGFLELVFVDDRVVNESTWNGAVEWLLHDATDRKMPNHVKRNVADLLPPVLSDLVSDGLEGRPKEFITPNEQRSVEDAASAIHAIRQLCLMFSKEKELPAQRDIDHEIARFVEIDEGLEDVLMQGTIPGIDNVAYRSLTSEQRRNVTRWDNLDVLDEENPHDAYVSSEDPTGSDQDAWRQAEILSERYQAWIDLGHLNRDR
jgi:hypothetical protein